MDHAGELRAAAALDVDDGTHGGAGTRQTAEEAGNGVAYTLPYELTVAVMLGLGDIVGDDGGKQCVDGAEACKSEAGDDSSHEDSAPVDAGEGDALFGKERHGDARGNLADGGYAVHIDEERDHSHHDEGDESGGHFLGYQGEEIDNGHGAYTQQESRKVGGGDGFRQTDEKVNHRAALAGTHEGIKLLQDDDDADAAHEAREDGIRYVADILAYLDEAKENLEEAAEDGGKSHGEHNLGDAAVGGRPGAGDEGGGDDGHGTRGTANLAVGTAEESGEESEEHSSGETHIGADGGCRGVGNAREGLYAEGQGEMEGDNAGGDTAEEVAFYIAKQLHINNC